MVKKLLCLCMAVFALVACGCGSDKSDTSQNAGQAYAVITDDTGKTVTLDKNYYIAMGDNTTNSLDSRFFGYVSEDRIKGKLLFRWWPLNRLGLI